MILSDKIILEEIEKGSIIGFGRRGIKGAR
jgi:hypothetical protein